MSPQPLVTIGLSTYNRVDSYFPLALASARAQTYPNLEIVVSDNCSTDGTQAYVDGLQDARIRYFRQTQNIGPNANFNYCVEQARGEWFLLLHDDDLIDPDFVSTCIEAAHGATDIGLIRTGTRIIDGDGIQVREKRNRLDAQGPVDFILGWFTQDTALYLCSTLFNTEQLKAIGGFRSKHNLFQDVVAEMKLGIRHGHVNVPEVKASFRRHGENFGSSVRLQEWIDDSLYLLDVMCELVPAEDRKRVRDAGLVYFARKNYRHATRIRDVPTRLRAYWNVYRTFGFRLTPLEFLAGRVGNMVTRRVRGLDEDDEKQSSHHPTPTPPKPTGRSADGTRSADGRGGVQTRSVGTPPADAAGRDASG